MRKPPALVSVVILSLVAGACGLWLPGCGQTSASGCRSPSAPAVPAEAPSAVRQTVVVGPPAVTGDEAPPPGYRHEELERHFREVIERNKPTPAKDDEGGKAGRDPADDLDHP
jgi:hypothetical protein